MLNTKCYTCDHLYQHEAPREVICQGCKSLLRFSSGLVPATVGYIAGLLIGSSQAGKCLSVREALEKAALDKVVDPEKLLMDLFDIGVSYRNGWTCEDGGTETFMNYKNIEMRPPSLTSAWEMA